MLMSVGGNETVRTATAQAIRILAEWPDQRDLLVSDLDRHIPGAVEEILRYRAPLRNIRRTANAGTEIDGQPIDEGGKVVCSFTAALRDPRVVRRARRIRHHPRAAPPPAGVRIR